MATPDEITPATANVTPQGNPVSHHPPGAQSQSASGAVPLDKETATPDKVNPATANVTPQGKPVPQQQGAQSQPVSDAAPIGKETSMDQARASADALMQQRQELIDRINTYAQVMQNPQLGMQDEARQLEAAWNKLNIENSQRVEAINQKAFAQQKKRGIIQLAASVGAGLLAAFGAHYLGARKIEKKWLRRGTEVGAAALGGAIAGGLMGKMSSADKFDPELANDSIQSITAINDSLAKLCTETEQKIQQKLLQISTNPTAGVASQQPAAAVDMETSAMPNQAGGQGSPADVPPLANLHAASAEPALPQMAAGVASRQ